MRTTTCDAIGFIDSCKRAQPQKTQRETQKRCTGVERTRMSMVDCISSTEDTMRWRTVMFWSSILSYEEGRRLRRR